MEMEEPIYLKKIAKGYAQWSTQTTFLDWKIETAQKLLTLPKT